MKHRSKVEVWLFAAILYVVGVLAAGGNRWIGGPVLLVLLLIALPQEYVTAPEALRVRAGPDALGHPLRRDHLRGRKLSRTRARQAQSPCASDGIPKSCWRRTIRAPSLPTSPRTLRT